MTSKTTYLFHKIIWDSSAVSLSWEFISLYIYSNENLCIKDPFMKKLLSIFYVPGTTIGGLRDYHIITNKCLIVSGSKNLEGML